MVKAKETFTIIHPQTKDGKDDKIMGIVTLSKQLVEVKAQLQEVMAMDGIDAINPNGRYSFAVVIAATFDPDEVWAEIKERLAMVASPLVIVKKSNG